MRTHLRLLLLIFLASCQDRASNIIEINGKYIDRDTIKFFPASEGHEVINGRYNNLIGLDSLEKANDWLEIRITRYWSDSQPLRLLVIKRRSGSWSGYFASMKPEYKPGNNSMRYMPETDIAHPPKSGWDNFGKQLLAMGILQIGKEIALEESGISSDADEINVEYASNDGYRKYIVYEPDKHNTPGKIKMTEISQVIEKELGFGNFATYPSK